MGGDPEKTGSTTAALHRGRIDIKYTVTGEDEGAVISECERGEDTAVRTFEDALKANLPADVLSIVRRQFTQVKEAHGRIRLLEKAAAAAK